MQVDKLIGIIRSQCDNPDPNRPTEDRIMLAIRKCAQLMQNEMQGALPGWNLEYSDVSAGDGLAPVPLPVNLGKVRRVYCMDPNTNESGLVTSIKLVDFDDLNGYSGRAAVAEAVAPLFTGGMLQLQFAPSLVEQKTYRVWYETGVVDEYGKADTPLPQVAQYHNYLADMATLEVLPQCWWGRLVEGELKMSLSSKMFVMQSHRKALYEQTMLAVIANQKNWKDHISTIFHNAEPSPNGYGDWADEDW